MIPRVFLSIILILSNSVEAGLPDTFVISRGNENYPPMEFEDNGKLSGFHVELIEAVSQKLGIKARFLSLPWKRAIQLTVNGEVDAISYITKNVVRARNIHFLSGNIISTQRASIIRSKRKYRYFNYDGSLNSIRDERIFIPLGFKYGEPFDSFPFTNRIEVDGFERILELVANNPSVMAILNPDVLHYAFQDHPEIEKIEVIQPPIQQADMYIGFSKAKDTDELSKAFAMALSSFKKTDDFQELTRKYGILNR